MKAHSVSKPRHAIVVDDDADVTEFISSVLRSKGYDVRCAFDGDQALALANELRPDIVFLDINLPTQDGWLVCNKLKSHSPAPKIVLATGETREDLYRFASFVKADDLIRKPFRANQIERTLKQLDGLEKTSA